MRMLCRLQSRKLVHDSSHGVRAGAVQEAPLAVYPFMQRQRSSVFPAAVTHLLKHVLFGAKRKASYLHATSRLQEHSVLTLQPGESWTSVINQVDITETQLLMYVKPVEDPVDFCGRDMQGTIRTPMSDMLVPHFVGAC